MKRLGSLILLALLAAAPATSPQGKVWDLPGLRGTASQIGKQLHDEVDQIQANIADAKSSVASIDEDIENEKKGARKQLQKDDKQYAYVCKVIEETQTALNNATGKAATERLQNKLDGFTKRQADIEDASFRDDPRIQPLYKMRRERQDRLDKLKETLDKAIAWRAQVGDAVLGSFTFSAPVVRGDVGIPGRVIIKEISGGVVTATGEVFLKVGQDGAAKEGIVTMRGRRVPTTFILGGIDTQGLSVGQHVILDRTVRVTTADLIDLDSCVITAERVRSEADDLLAVLHEWQSVEKLKD